MSWFLVLCCSLWLSGTALAGVQPWLGLQGGGMYTSPAAVDFQAPPFKGTLTGVETAPALSLGVALGLDFTGPVGRYLGCSLDLSYNRLAVPAQVPGGTVLPAAAAVPALPGVDGRQWSLALLGRLRLPLGRLEPGLALGPALVWTRMDFSPWQAGSQTSTDVALVVEPSLRLFLDADKRLFLEGFYRFRYLHPRFHFRRPVNYISAAAPLYQQHLGLRLAYRF